MSYSINTVALSGTVAGQAEASQTKSGNTLLKFVITVTDGFRDPASGELKERVYSVPVVRFGTPSGLAEMLTDGTHVTIQGKIRASDYTDRNNIPRHSIEIRASTIDVDSAPAQFPQQPQPIAQNAQGGYAPQPSYPQQPQPNYPQQPAQAQGYANLPNPTSPDGGLFDDDPQYNVSDRRY